MHVFVAIAAHIQAVAYIYSSETVYHSHAFTDLIKCKPRRDLRLQTGSMHAVVRVRRKPTVSCAVGSVQTIRTVHCWNEFSVFSQVVGALMFQLHYIHEY
jgi:hypothetical protein